MAGAAIVRGDLYYHSAAGLLDAILGEGVAFERTYREPFFDYLDHHPEAQAAFIGSMSGRAEQESADVTTAYDFSGLQSIVDVGGGQGTLLAEILRRTPDPARDPGGPSRGVAHGSGPPLREAGVTDRATCVPGDFFGRPARWRRRLPVVAECFTTGRTSNGQHILAALPPSRPDHGRLIVVEAVLPDRAVDAPAAVRMDLHMMLLFGSRKHTRAEFDSPASGVRLRRPARDPDSLAGRDRGHRGDPVLTG